ncbi:hypothetical protein [Natrinema gari]|uniref:hypothetical protein n=1 Tax=Natrinema gari TaxID=419186 RepID=UPI00126834DD|nr:hypothetical protein [Natrinema gari]
MIRLRHEINAATVLKRLVTVARPVSFALSIGVVGIYAVVIPDLLLLLGLFLRRFVFPSNSVQLPLYWLWILWLNASLVNAFVLAIGIRVLEKTKQVLELIWEQFVPPYYVDEMSTGIQLILFEKVKQSEYRSWKLVKIFTAAGVLFSLLLSTTFYRFIYLQNRWFIPYLGNVPIDLLFNTAAIIFQAPVSELGQPFVPKEIPPGEQLLYIIFNFTTVLLFTLGVINLLRFISERVLNIIYSLFSSILDADQGLDTIVWPIWVTFAHNLLFYVALYNDWAAI